MAIIVTDVSRMVSDSSMVAARAAPTTVSAATPPRLPSSPCSAATWAASTAQTHASMPRGACIGQLGSSLGRRRPVQPSFAARRLEGLLDEPRPGRPRTVTDEQVEQIVTTTLESSPKDATHWSTRSLAAHLGLSQDAVWRTWQAFGLQPHRQEKLKLSTDPQFIEKVYDICGLYLNPPERAVVLCVDEKSQIQALDRTRPILPMLPGTPQRATHDYKRNGTSSLYAALDLASGKVIGALHERHRATGPVSCAGSTPTRSSPAASR